MDKVIDSRIRIWDIVVILCLFFSAFASMLSDEVNRVALYGALPLAFAISFFKCKSFLLNKYTNILFVLFLWIVTSSIWATYSNYANTELHRVLGAFIMCYIMAANARDSKMVPWLYATYLVLYLGAWYYASNHIVVDIEMMESDDDRMNDEKLNANTMAYYTFYSTFVLYVLSEISHKIVIKRIFNFAFLGMIPISFFVALTTASRQVLLIQIPLISILLYNRYIKNQSYKNKTFFVFFTIVSVFFLLNKVIPIYENSYLAVRASANLQDDSRSKLMIDAYNVGIEYFPFGVGAGNYIAYSFNNHFSHITYLELFANQGFVGVFLYVCMLWVFIKDLYRQYKMTGDSILFLFLIFGLIYIVDNVFYVFYSDIWLISFFVLVASHYITYIKTNS